MAKLEKENGFFIHPSAEINKNSTIGEGSYIWNQVQVRENTKIGKNCILSKDVYIDKDVVIGNNVKIQNGVSVYQGVTVEDDVFLGPHMTFTNDMFPRAFIGDFKIFKTYVKKGASIGAHATIICGITIGEYAMIGAGSVVTKDVPDHALIVGNPGKIIGFACKCGQKLQKIAETDKNVKMVCTKCNEDIFIDLNNYNKINKKK